MTKQAPATPRSRGQGGPPLGVLAVVVTGLFIAGLVAGTVMAGGATFPSPFGAAAGVVDYFREHHAAVQMSGFLQFAAAIPLAIYAAAVSARLHNLGVRAPGATIAQAGGVLAAGLMMLSGLFTWVLARPELLEEAGIIRTLHFLAFAAGGPGHVVPFGLLLAGIAVPGLLARLLPRWLAWTGLVIAAIAELSTLTLLVSDAAVLLPIARFIGLAWLIAAGFLLPRHRARKSATTV